MNVQLDPRLAGKLLASSLTKGAVNRRRLHLLDLHGLLSHEPFERGNTLTEIIAAPTLGTILCFRHRYPPFVKFSMHKLEQPERLTVTKKYGPVKGPIVSEHILPAGPLSSGRSRAR
jgi:hypothetical protein